MRCRLATQLGNRSRLDLAVLLHPLDHRARAHIVWVAQRQRVAADTRCHRLDEHGDQQVVADVVAGSGEEGCAGVSDLLHNSTYRSGMVAVASDRQVSQMSELEQYSSRDDRKSNSTTDVNVCVRLLP